MFSRIVLCSLLFAVAGCASATTERAQHVSAGETRMFRNRPRAYCEDEVASRRWDAERVVIERARVGSWFCRLFGLC
jgi:hypothetical protein